MPCSCLEFGNALVNMSATKPGVNIILHLVDTLLGNVNDIDLYGSPVTSFQRNTFEFYWSIQQYNI